MKKGLSVLLIAAALFGFYGGAVNLNDVLACKDYWEEEGEKSTADMNKLEDGLNQLKDNEQAYLDGLDAVAEGEEALAQGEQDYADGQATLAKGEADYAAAPAKLRAGEKKLAAGKAAYNAGKKELEKGKKELDAGKAKLKQLKQGLSDLSDGYAKWKAGYQKAAAAGIPEDYQTNNSIDSAKCAAAIKALEDKKAALQAFKDQRDELVKNKGAIEAQISKGEADIAKTEAAIEKAKKEGTDYSGLEYNLTQLKEGLATANGQLAQVKGGIDQIDAGVRAQAGIPDEAGTTLDDIWTDIENGITNLSGLKALADGRAEMQKQILGLLDQVKDNEDVVKKLGGKSTLNTLVAGLKGTDVQFAGTVEKLMQFAPGLVASVTQQVNEGQAKYDAGAAELAAGAKQIKAGQAELNKGYADYKAAPAKLAAGRAALAEGLQKLMDGRKELAAGKDKLAEYEDGEQQVRDGLATLMGTEPNGGLESILDRRSGDDDFDNGDEHLDLDEGLDAVDVGRGYQADSGELITKEITNRAIGTAAGLGAAALAVLAAILSFLKKNKGAGVLALLAAAAGGAGIAAGTSAGTEFSSIAGSAVGATPWIAFGILAAVAAVHAIAHFASKEA